MQSQGHESDAAFRGDQRFRVLGFVGSGGMGDVYRVFDAELGGEVALKTIHARAAEDVYRLKQEFRSLKGVIHPNLIQLHDLVVRDDACFFTMEFVEGEDFVSHVRRGSQGALDDAGLHRFVDAASQLARGLAALHGAGRLHRDVKPPNVRVDPQGRVVILDFDLAAPLAEVGVQEGMAGELAGTYAYMPHEQLWGMELTPAADWYAAGVVFHEALTGRHPFDGGAPPGPDAAEGGVELPAWEPALPEALRSLVAALLDPRPERRPGAEEVLERLGAEGARRAAARPRRRLFDRERFVGRESERGWLRRIFDAGRGVRVAGIHGVSGIGKSELVRHFLAELEAAQQAVVLTGRCHPQESVPFKALDPIVDALTRHLVAQDETRLRELLPEHAGAAARLFPVLSRVPGLDAGGREERLDVAEARQRGVGALRELLRRVASSEPLVVWIDDAQWSDTDSAELLGELLLPPAAPPLLLLLTYRSEDREGMGLLERLSELAREFSSVALEERALPPLSGDEARELARRLWPSERGLGPPADLVAEAAGSPFLLGELAWYVRRRPDLDASAARRPDLGEVIAARLLELPPEERRLLELVSVCGRPTERALLLEAAELGGTGRPLLERLEGVGLLRTSPLGDEWEVEAYHDRIRETVSAQLSTGSLARRHRALAASFEASGRAEPDVLAHHFHGAGELPKAADYALTAADRAAESLAFVRAAELYRQAREWDPRDARRERELRVREGDSLAKGARLVDAGHLLLEAARDAPRGEALELRRQAAEHVVAGDVDEGLGVLEGLLAELGMRFPSSAQRALLAAMARLGGIALRGFQPRGRQGGLDGEERIRIDLCYGVGVRLVSVDSARGIYFSMLSLDRALRAGDPARVARSLTAVGGSISVVGGGLLGRIGRRMMESAEAIAAQEDSPWLSGTIDVALGQVLMLGERCREAVERSDRGVRTLSERCQGYAFECNFGRANAIRALEELGQPAEVARRAQELRDAAIAVGNHASEATASQYLAIARIACDDVEGARGLARRAFELQAHRDFHMQHFYNARIHALCDLYEGRPQEGWERIVALEPGLRRSGLLRIPLLRTDATSLRAQLALGAARCDPARRPQWLDACGRSARRLAREPRRDARLHARLFEAGMAALRGEEETAAARLDEAAQIGDAAELALRAVCARLRAAQLRGDASAVERARAEMLRRGVERPERWADLCAPGF